MVLSEISDYAVSVSVNTPTLARSQVLEKVVGKDFSYLLFFPNKPINKLKV